LSIEKLKDIPLHVDILLDFANVIKSLGVSASEEDEISEEDEKKVTNTIESLVETLLTKEGWKISHIEVLLD